MASTLATLAEAVKDALNGAADGTFTLSFEAERVYIPEINLENVGTDLSVIVVGSGLEHTPLTRAAFQKRLAVDIGIQQRLTQGGLPGDETGNTQLDGLMELTEQIADFFAPGTTYGEAKLVTVAADPLYVPAHLREKRIYTSVVTLNFKKL